MKKNGFTLVELLATLVLTGMLATVIINYSIKNNNRVKDESRRNMVHSIEIAAENYATNNSSKISGFDTNDFAYITLETLIKEEQFTSSLIDQTKDASLPISDTVYVTKSSVGAIKAYYDINQGSKPKIVLNGSYNLYLKKGNTYTELGATAISSTGVDITSSIEITGAVDTNTKGNYMITYTVGDSSIIRNVIVY